MREKPLVLLVDDEDVFIEIASTKLAENYEIRAAHSVAEALREAAVLIPDLILSDIYMSSDQNGWDLVLALRENSSTRNIPFAFFTSLRDPFLELQRERIPILKRLGSVTILSKMDDVDQLGKRVSEILHKG